MSCFMGNITAKVPANDTMPCWIILFIKFFLDIGCNILNDKMLLIISTELKFSFIKYMKNIHNLRVKFRTYLKKQGYQPN